MKKLKKFQEEVEKCLWQFDVIDHLFVYFYFVPEDDTTDDDDDMSVLSRAVERLIFLIALIARLTILIAR